MRKEKIRIWRYSAGLHIKYNFILEIKNEYKFLVLIILKWRVNVKKKLCIVTNCSLSSIFFITRAPL